MCVILAIQHFGTERNSVAILDLEFTKSSETVNVVIYLCSIDVVLAWSRAHKHTFSPLWKLPISLALQDNIHTLLFGRLPVVLEFLKLEFFQLLIYIHRLILFWIEVNDDKIITLICIMTLFETFNIYISLFLNSNSFYLLSISLCISISEITIKRICVPSLWTLWHCTSTYLTLISLLEPDVNARVIFTACLSSINDFAIANH